MPYVEARHKAAWASRERTYRRCAGLCTECGRDALYSDDDLAYGRGRLCLACRSKKLSRLAIALTHGENNHDAL